MENIVTTTLYTDVCGIIDHGREQAYAAVNSSMIETYSCHPKSSCVLRLNDRKSSSAYNTKIRNNMRNNPPSSMAWWGIFVTRW